MENFATIPQLIGNLTKTHKSRLLLQRRDGWSWKQITWLDFDSEVKNVASFLLSLGFKPGDSALVVSSNSNECLISELAVYSLGGRVIPFSDYNTFTEYGQVVCSAKPRYLFAENEQYISQIKSNQKLMSHIDKVFVLNDSKLGENENVVPYKAALKFGGIKKKELADKIKKITEQIKPEQKALTFYLKTTGDIQEYALDHKKIIELLSAAYGRLKFMSSEDQSFSYLISSNVYEKLINMLAICLGIRIIIAEDRQCFFEDILEAKPTILFETKSGIEDICNQFNDSNLKNMLGGRVRYLITDEMPDTTYSNRLKSFNISVISIPQFVRTN